MYRVLSPDHDPGMCHALRLNLVLGLNLVLRLNHVLRLVHVLRLCHVRRFRAQFQDSLRAELPAIAKISIKNSTINMNTISVAHR